MADWAPKEFRLGQSQGAKEAHPRAPQGTSHGNSPGAFIAIVQRLPDAFRCFLDPSPSCTSARKSYLEVEARKQVSVSVTAAMAQVSLLRAPASWPS